jgi:hypothetical protein
MVSLAVGLLAACDLGTSVGAPKDEGVTGSNDGNNSGQTAGAQFQSFTPVTRGATYIDDGLGHFHDFSLMMTDATGGIGCALNDPSANPGKAVSRVLFTVLGNTWERASICGPQARAIGNMATGVFERWDASGTKTDTVKAIGGATSFARSSAGANLMRCDVETTLTFPGGAVFSDKFSYNYSNYIATSEVSQACIEGEACRCEAWQTCNANRQCVDLACIPSQNSCPSDGGVGCCAGSGSCTDGKCCVGSGTACNPYANDCCYKCEYFDNSVYHGYYCARP